MARARRWSSSIVAILAATLALSACEQAPEPQPEPTSTLEQTETTEPTVEPTEEPTPQPTAPTGPHLADGTPLPGPDDPCLSNLPAAGDTAAFVANGLAFSLDPSGTRLTCLFAASDPGPFEWGPLGDRALLGGLEVVGLGEAPSRSAQGILADATSWGRPTGKSVVFVPMAADRLQKIHLDRAALEDVTPLPDSTYLSVTYHPSGLAFGFALRDEAGDESLWLSSNTGEDPRRMVFTEVGTEFGALDFTNDGKRLLYAAQHREDDHADLHTIDLTDTSQAPVLWSGPSGIHILDIQAGPKTETVAFTIGTSCEDSVAMARTHARAEGFSLLPGEARPTRAVGWLSSGKVLVAAGGCDEPLDLSAVALSTGAVTPLVFEVDAASVRTPAPTPPPPLPDEVPVDGGFG